MAVWQYQLNIVPKKAVLEKYGTIPNELLIDDESWEQYWENIVDIENLPKPNFEDANTIKWWTDIKLDLKKTAEQIDKLVTRANWGQNSSDCINWKGNSEVKEDNDCFISFDPNSQIIEDFHFRVDLRKKENITKFLSGMLNLCEQNNLMVFNINGVLFEPKSDLIYEDLKKSNTVAFLTDPEKFLDKIAEKENKIQPKKVGLWSKVKAYFE
ncbi:hypothetical protein [Aequorivita antarctica]|uniref:Uncharacterized protein n=1 Tax=Aequorivita antarctica TaxID=153266 RepID=A0A5C6YUN6_9FLAO|nr:hypothetical protein [Aequorivita antarctica]TXD71265.1 hypothetical protein ESU54_17475 [Aequorivita antarctica]SRX76528.1 hypothetical protein AEQU3_03528 [Aequorivita antarctica]